MLSPEFARPARSRSNGDRGGGEFVDGIVEASMRSLIVQLKAEYQKEFLRAEHQKEFLSPLRAASRSQEQAEPTVDVITTRLPNMLDEDVALRSGQASLGSQRSVSDHCLGEDVSQRRFPTKRSLSAHDATFARAESLPQLREASDEDSETPNGVSARACSAPPLLGIETASAAEAPIPILSQEEIDVLTRSRGAQKRLEIEGEKKHFGRFSVAATPRSTSARQRLVATIVSSRSFDFFMGVIIMCNAATIGMETTITVHGKELPFGLRAIEYLFMVIYIAEIAMRFYAIGLHESLHNNWVRLDFIIVLAGILNFLLTTFASGGMVVITVVDNINMLKCLRLARLARTVRVLVHFRTLWLLVKGLLSAMMPMLWTTVIIVIITYIFSVVGMEMIVNASDDPEFTIAAKNFDNIGESMLTLWQFITLDNVSEIYRPLIARRPGLVIFFFVFFLFGPVALMSLVTALMVESSLRIASDDVEATRAWEAMRKKELMPKLLAIFEALDCDGNGLVDLSEILAAPEEIKETIKRIAGLEDIDTIFNMLDLDGSGTVSIEEFVDGIMRSQVDKPSELIVIMKQGRTIIDFLSKQNLKLGLRDMPLGSAHKASVKRASLSRPSDIA